MSNDAVGTGNLWSLDQSIVSTRQSPFCLANRIRGNCYRIIRDGRLRSVLRNLWDVEASKENSTIIPTGLRYPTELMTDAIHFRNLQNLKMNRCDSSPQLEELKWNNHLKKNGVGRWHWPVIPQRSKIEVDGEIVDISLVPGNDTTIWQEQLERRR